MRAGNEGLRGKYIVHKVGTGEEVNNCFVLRPDKDTAAVAAIRAYAAVTDNKVLAADLIRWIGAESNDLLTPDQLREMDEKPVWWENKYHENGWGILSVQEFEEIIYIVPANAKPFVAVAHGEMNHLLGLKVYCRKLDNQEDMKG